MRLQLELWLSKQLPLLLSMALPSPRTAWVQAELARAMWLVDALHGWFPRQKCWELTHKSILYCSKVVHYSQSLPISGKADPWPIGGQIPTVSPSSRFWICALRRSFYSHPSLFGTYWSISNPAVGWVCMLLVWWVSGTRRYNRTPSSVILGNLPERTSRSWSVSTSREIGHNLSHNSSWGWRPDPKKAASRSLLSPARFGFEHCGLGDDHAMPLWDLSCIWWRWTWCPGLTTSEQQVLNVSDPFSGVCLPFQVLRYVWQSLDWVSTGSYGWFGPRLQAWGGVPIWKKILPMLHRLQARHGVDGQGGDASAFLSECGTRQWKELLPWVWCRRAWLPFWRCECERCVDQDPFQHFTMETISAVVKHSIRPGQTCQVS